MNDEYSSRFTAVGELPVFVRVYSLTIKSCANRQQILRNVTLPLVMPSVTICLFLTLSNSFKLFDQNLALTAGAPSKQTTMLALDIYNTFYGRSGYEGVGQAKAVVFFIMVALIVLIQLLITRRREVEV